MRKHLLISFAAIMVIIQFSSRITYAQDPKVMPLDFVSAAKVTPQSEKGYTIMIYMNGSDLERETAAATEDMIEMAESYFDEKDINLVIFTGGCNKWHIDCIPNGVNTIFQLSEGCLYELAEAGDKSTGDPAVLSGFINFSRTMFPAKKYGLIFWNHGGGAVVGYGSDERYKDSPSKAVMKLADIDNALGAAGMTGKFEFIGFDTCLMATLEMACIAEKYSKYMIASEEIEPNQGWDYSFLGEVTAKSSGFDVGSKIIDYYRNFYRKSDLDDMTTLSLTDLSKIRPVANAFENLAQAAGNALNTGNYNLISKARSSNRTFGGGIQGEETDMIDVLQLAISLSAMFPDESALLSEKLTEAVPYNYSSSDAELGGLSIYFPFSNKEYLDYSLDVYKSMNQLPRYTGFISNFSQILSKEPSTWFAWKDGLTLGTRSNFNIMLTQEQLNKLTELRVNTWLPVNESGRELLIQVGDNSEAAVKNDGTIIVNLKPLLRINGRLACAYENNRVADTTRYAIPIKLNGADANLVAVYSNKQPYGKIIGAIPTDGDAFNILDKKVVDIREGDRIALRYYIKPVASVNDREENIWYIGEEFAVTDPLQIEEDHSDEFSDGYKYSLDIVDTQKNTWSFSLVAG